MRQASTVVSWVVYETPPTARMPTMQVVCELGEWEELKIKNSWVEARLVRDHERGRGRAGGAGRDRGSPERSATVPLTNALSASDLKPKSAPLRKIGPGSPRIRFVSGCAAG